MGLSQKIKNFVFTKQFLKNIGAIVLIFIIIGFVLNLYLSFFTNHGEKVVVPNLIDKNVGQIAQLMEELGLEYEVSESVYDPSKPEGTILFQDPLPTSKSKLAVKSGRTIRIKVSLKSQMVEVPNCVDKSQRFAESILKNRGFKYVVEYVPSTESAGAVIKQLYKGKVIDNKTKVSMGATITLVVGKRSADEQFMLPNLVGLTICDAKNRLTPDMNVNLIVNCVGCATSADSCSAVVSSQSPEFIEGANISGGATITIHATK